MDKIVKSIFSAAMLCLLLCGCGAQSAGEELEEISAVVTAESIEELESYPALRYADLTGSVCYDELLAYAARHPEVELHFNVVFPNGREEAWDAKTLDLSLLDQNELREAAEYFQYMPKLTEVKLGAESHAEALLPELIEGNPGIHFDYCFTIKGSTYDFYTDEIDLSGMPAGEIRRMTALLPGLKELKTIHLGDEADCAYTWEEIDRLCQACPEAVIDYSFTLYDKSFNLSDETMDIKRVQVGDEGALVRQVAGCMRNLKTLDMDSCGVSNEAMAALRDAFPEVNVIWRVNFGDKYSTRTDVEMILASAPDLAGELIHENVENLKYCTKVKYLDLGHNNLMDTIDFVRYMPDLEVAILAMSFVEDFSALTECPKLEYLELFTTRLHDLTPLAELKNLKHLNICYNFAINDISPLYSMTQLERLWIGCYDPVPPEQIEKMQECVPNCIINVTTKDPTEEGWRIKMKSKSGWTEYDDRYALLREQFNYYTESSYCFYWTDPLYWYGW